MPQLTTAETRAYRQICTADGAIFVVACDQRGGMRTLLASDAEAQARITNQDLGEVKAGLVRDLANETPCVLLDPVCALPKVVDEAILARDTALLVGMDASGWDTDAQTGLRRSRLVPGIGPHAVRALGGTAGKIMVYLRPDREDAESYNARLLRDALAEFAADGQLLVVEILVYRLDDENRDAYAARLPELVEGAARLGVQCGAKVLKLQYPGSAPACAAVTRAAGSVPWAVLSSGVDHDTFLGQIEEALGNGAAGVIVGRALWKDCISLAADVQRDRLRNIGIPRVRQIDGLLKSYRLGKP